MEEGYIYMTNKSRISKKNVAKVGKCIPFERC